MMMLTCILYIPKWENFDRDWYQSIAWLGKEHQIILILDGTTTLNAPQNCFVLQRELSDGPVFVLTEILPQLNTSTTLFLRQGIRFTETDLIDVQKKKEHCLVISPSHTSYLNDDCLLFSTKELLPYIKQINHYQFVGYAIALSAILEHNQIPFQTIPNSLNKQQQILASPYILQQMANLLQADLKELSYSFSISEEWFQPQTETVSIVVLVWNNLKVTIPCLLSIMRFTKHPFELIIIDNGSTEPVGAWVEKNLSKYQNVVYHRNEQNQGFPQGCNDGMAKASGDHILLLNNDTIVTPYWITRMVAGFRDSKVGLIGPLSINNGSKQNILTFLPTQYQHHLQTQTTPWRSTKEMLRFTEAFCRNQLGSTNNTSLSVLIGLCFFIRKDVYQQIGGMDPIFGFGNCEDGDYCFRTARLGFSILHLYDVYVDHVGSATFSKSSLPYEQLVWQNIIYFHYKNLPPDILKLALQYCQTYQQAQQSRLFWLQHRQLDLKQDYIPFQMEEYFTHQERTETALLMFPPIWENNWLERLKQFIPKSNIILRVEPPAPLFVAQIQKQIHNLSLEEQQKISIDSEYVPTTERAKIYQSITSVIELPRFDFFRFEREATFLTIPIIRIEES